MTGPTGPTGSVPGRAPRAARGLPVVGILLGAGLAIVVACGGSRPPAPDWQLRQQKENEVTALWTQIRTWRHEAHMPLDPPRSDVFQWLTRPVQEASRVCPDGHQVPETCNDTCNVADDICDNAERICSIADELGPRDTYSQEKCASAKASCREAKQRCCACSDVRTTSEGLP